MGGRWDALIPSLFLCALLRSIMPLGTNEFLGMEDLMFFPRQAFAPSATLCGRQAGIIVPSPIEA